MKLCTPRSARRSSAIVLFGERLTFAASRGEDAKAPIRLSNSLRDASCMISLAPDSSLKPVSETPDAQPAGAERSGGRQRQSSENAAGASRKLRKRRKGSGNVGGIGEPCWTRTSDPLLKSSTTEALPSATEGVETR